MVPHLNNAYGAGLGNIGAFVGGTALVLAYGSWQRLQVSSELCAEVAELTASVSFFMSEEPGRGSVYGSSPDAGDGATLRLLNEKNMDDMKHQAVLMMNWNSNFTHGNRKPNSTMFELKNFFTPIRAVV